MGRIECQDGFGLWARGSFFAERGSLAAWPGTPLFLRDAKSVFQLQRVPFLAARPFRFFEQAVFFWGEGLPMAARGPFLAVKSLLHAGVRLCTILAWQSAGGGAHTCGYSCTCQFGFSGYQKHEQGSFRPLSGIATTTKKECTVAVSGCFELFRAVSSEYFHFAHSPELLK